MWELEWKKEKAEKERKELLNKKKNKEKEQAMYAAWGTGSSDMYEDVEKLALMAIEESDAEPESDSEETEVNFLNLKDKLAKFSKKKLSLLLLASIDKSQELVNTKSQLLASLSSLKFEHIDLNKNKLDLQDKIKQLETQNLELRTKNSKLKVLGKGKEGELPDQKLEVDKLKQTLGLEVIWKELTNGQDPL